MSFQALSSLLAAFVTAAIGGSVLLSDRRRRAYVEFATFTFCLALYHLATFLAAWLSDATFSYLALWPAVFIPTTATRFFRTFLSEPAIGAPVRRPSGTYFFAALWCLALLYGALARPIHRHLGFQIPLAIYVFVSLYRCVLDLYRQGKATVSRVEKTRIQYLTIGGFVATTLALTDLLPRIGVAFPTIGGVLSLLYLYFLSQTLSRYRLLDLHELVGRMLVVAALVAILTVVYGLMLSWVGGGQQQGVFIVNTVVASFVILILVEPARSLIEKGVRAFLMRERGDLRTRLDGLRRELMNVLDDRDMTRRIVASLEASRSVTHAGIYLIDGEGGGFDLAGYLGPAPVERLDLAARRPFFDRLRLGPLTIQGLDAERERLRCGRSQPKEKDLATIEAVRRTLAECNADVAVPILGGADEREPRAGGARPGERRGQDTQPGEAAGVLLGFMALRDERVQRAAALDDLEPFRLLAAQAGITLENSRLYERMKERDRLAALGAMAAGLAHEIRNPLGAIKGAAQLLVGPDGKPNRGAEGELSEFLGIIIDETNRLNKVVTQFLDYSRPWKGDLAELDVNEVVRRTVLLLEARAAEAQVTIELELDAELPRLRGDAAHLQQVFLNLGLNAIDATSAGGSLVISTLRRDTFWRGAPGTSVEIRFRDTGSGISREDLRNLFIPFFTTKEKGTGLGLSISQRIVTQHGGTIDVKSEPGKGSTFAVVLPAETTVTTSCTQPRPAPPEADAAEAP